MILFSAFAIKLSQRCAIASGGCAIPSSVYDGDGGSATSTSNTSEIRDEPEVPAIDDDERGLFFLFILCNIEQSLSLSYVGAIRLALQMHSRYKWC